MEHDIHCSLRVRVASELLQTKDWRPFYRRSKSVKEMTPALAGLPLASLAWAMRLKIPSPRLKDDGKTNDPRSTKEERSAVFESRIGTGDVADRSGCPSTALTGEAVGGMPLAVDTLSLMGCIGLAPDMDKRISFSSSILRKILPLSISLYDRHRCERRPPLRLRNSTESLTCHDVHVPAPVCCALPRGFQTTSVHSSPK